MAWQDKPLKKQGIAAVPQRFNPDTNEWEVETTESDPVHDVDVLDKLSDIETKVQTITDRTEKTIYGLSTETKPSADTKGTTFFEMDTTDTYMWDGSQWRLI